MDIRVALIAAAAAVAGALAGGAATYLATVKTETAENAREGRRLNREAERAAEADRRRRIGAARLLFTELLVAAEEMTVLEHDRIYRPFDRSFRVEMPNSDIKLIYEELDGEDFGKVMFALRTLPTLETFVRSKYERGHRRVSAADRCIIRSDLRLIRIAAAPLADLAEAPGRDTAPWKPVDCSRFGAAFGG